VDVGKLICVIELDTSATLITTNQFSICSNMGDVQPSATKSAIDSKSGNIKQVYTGIASKGKNDFEFGGPLGVTALMLWSHYILLYFW
jgi:hypothetical protein